MLNKPARLALAAVVSVLLAAAQSEDHAVTLRLTNGRAVAKGFIGGESHDSYAVRLDAGANAVIAISSKSGRASFMLSQEAGFSGAAPVDFGKAESDGRRWQGEIPRSAVYHIYVTSYPASHYRLSVQATSKR